MKSEIPSHRGAPQQFWIDHLVEKHECFHCEMRSEEIQIHDETVELLVPSWAVRFEVVEGQKSSNKLFLILRDLETQGWDDPLGIVAIAVQELDQVSRYRVILWHATYPYIWKHLDPRRSTSKNTDAE